MKRSVLVSARVAAALKSGRLIRMPCVECGAVNSQAHHPDYAKPLEVVWLCHKHHLERHGKTLGNVAEIDETEELEPQLLEVTVLGCAQCDHHWIQRREHPPKICPRCKRKNWSQEVAS